MIHITSRISILLVTLLLFASLGSGQEAPRDSLQVSLPQGGFATFRTEVSSLKSKANSSDESDWHILFDQKALIDDQKILHRLLVDQAGRILFAYDLVIALDRASKRFHVIAQPYDRVFVDQLRGAQQRSLAGPRNYSVIPTLPRSTQESLVGDGDTFALDLLLNERLGVKIVDYVKVGSERGLRSLKSNPKSPRDFSITNVEMAVRNYRLRIDGEDVPTVSMRRTSVGALVWICLPGRGRFIFSLLPHEGYDFKKVGVIEENKITFLWKSTQYELISTAPIVGSGGIWNLWVFYDPEYVDLLAPSSPLTSKRVARRGSILYPEPVGPTVSIGQPKNGQTGLNNKNKAKDLEPIWITIGAAKSIEGLLLKK